MEKKTSKSTWKLTQEEVNLIADCLAETLVMHDEFPISGNHISREFLEQLTKRFVAAKKTD